MSAPVVQTPAGRLARSVALGAVRDVVLAAGDNSSAGQLAIEFLRAETIHGAADPVDAEARTIVDVELVGALLRAAGAQVRALQRGEPVSTGRARARYLAEILTAAAQVMTALAEDTDSAEASP